MLRANNSFDSMSDALLLSRTASIVSDLSVNFATAPSLPDLIAAKDAFQASLALAITGNRLQKTQKNERKAELVRQLHKMSNYIVWICDEDFERAQGSGFTFAKTSRTPSPAATPAQNQKAESGVNPGEMKFSFEPVPAAAGYTYQCTPDPVTPTSEWIKNMGTKSEHVFTGLESGKRYWFQVIAVGRNGSPAYSEPISRIVV